MKLNVLIFGTLTFLLCFMSSCNSENETLDNVESVMQQNCIQSIIRIQNLVEYNGENLHPCIYYLNLHEYKGENYFSGGCYCCRFRPHLFNCNGEEISEIDPVFFKEHFSKINESFVRIVAYMP
ncbi:MAG: hypothetical protein HOP11_00745 [Saprospiraceae bacterium]|nr:hypothetical protein [Saprospiraceae bacterium]